MALQALQGAVNHLLLLRGAPPPPHPGADATPTDTDTPPDDTSSGRSACPFGFGGGGGPVEAQEEKGEGGSHPPPLFGRQRVQVLYEKYIHLPALRDVWEAPVTPKPELEPCFAAACHGLEICFLLLTHFIEDTRAYVVKRPRVELVAEDIVRQCTLLAEIVDGELEEDPPASPIPTSTKAAAAIEAFPSTDSLSGLTTVSPASTASPPSAGTTGMAGVTGAMDELRTPPALGPAPSPSFWSRSSLTQDFPFDGCPPTTSQAARSPALELLHEAVRHSLPKLSPSERVSLVKVIRNLTNAVEGLTQSWTVGLGLEAQLNGLRELVGLRRLPSFDGRVLFLDYRNLVKPEVVAATYEAAREYEHAEDFFFRSVHLGTECWAFVASARLEGARQLAEQGEWHNAAARARQAAHILAYLGKHVLMLTSMVLRDYLELKVEIEGTSGEGSKLVRGFRPAAKRLFDPLKLALLSLEEEGENGGEEDEEGLVKEALLRVYEAPERHPQLYTYAKSLELLETGLVSGFYYNHFCLATNVIGLEARGTMNRAVKALKSTYETPVFPLLDQTRSTLGARMDARLRHRKGNLLRALLPVQQPTAGV